MRDGATKMLVDVAVTSALQNVGWTKPAWMPALHAKATLCLSCQKLVTSQTSNFQEDHNYPFISHHFVTWRDLRLECHDKWCMCDLT